MAIALALACSVVALESSSELFERKIYYHHRMIGLLGRIDEMRGQIASDDRELAGMRGENAAQNELPIILAAPDVRLFRLNPPRGGTGKGFVAMSRKVDSAVIEVSDLPSPPAGANYTLWWTYERHAPAVAAIFRTAPDGTVTAFTKLPTPGTDANAALVTLEADVHVTLPTGAMKLHGLAAKPQVKSATKKK
jgi:hypothetical protein